MPRRNREYKKGAPHRDARLFVIVAEGEREDAYFQWFHEKNQRIKVHIVAREQNRSAPTFFLERATQYLEQIDLKAVKGDSLWFVVDVDRWERSAIDDLQRACEQEPGWHLAVSNPCFEVWILYHQMKEIKDTGQACQDLKQQVHLQFKGGFSVETVCPQIATAVDHAKARDSGPDAYFPDRMQTKVYLLGAQILSLLGKNWQEIR